MRRLRRPRVKLKWAKLDNEEAETDRMFTYEQTKHKLFQQSSLLFELQFGISLDDFVTNIHPIRQWHLFRHVADPLSIASASKVSSIHRAVDETINLAAAIHEAEPYRHFSPVRNSVTLLSRCNVAAESFVDIVHRYLSDNSGTMPVKPGRSIYNLKPTPEDFSPIDVPIVIDTGASLSLTPYKEDFVEPPQPCLLKALHNVSSTTKVEGVGTVAWRVIDLYGAVHTIKTRAYYVPSASIRLYSPQRHFQQSLEGALTMNWEHLTLRFPGPVKLSFPIAPNGLPLMFLDNNQGPIAGVTFADAAMFSDVPYILANVADETNQNLSGPQRELLLWHHKLAHVNFDWLQTLARQGRDSSSSRRVLETKFASIANCRAPLCAACQMGKGKRRPTGAKQVHDRHVMKLKEEILQPGESLHLDQYQSSATGRLPHTRGLEKNSLRYNGGLIAVDVATGKVFLRHQVSLACGETVQALQSIVQDVRSHGVSVKSIHTDNAPFNALEFRDYVAHELHARQTFSGVGAHHQDGIAERAIGTITSWARTMMLHSIIHWPDVADIELWPFAMDHAVFLWNSLPRKDSLVSPDELFSGVRFPDYSHLQRSHVWGCPVYVLDPALQDGKKIPKWKPRSRRGFYLGQSSKHSSSVALVLSLKTGHVSPQWHCVFDDLFSTVVSPSGMFDHSFDADEWNKLISSGHERFNYDEYDYDDRLIPPPPLAPEWTTVEPPDDSSVRHRSRSPPRGRIRTPEPPPPRTLTETVDDLFDALDTPSSSPEGAPTPIVSPPPPPAPEGEDDHEDMDVVEQVPEDVPDERPDPAPDPDDTTVSSSEQGSPVPRTLRRSRRNRRPNTRVFGPEWSNPVIAGSYDHRRKLRMGAINDQFLQTLDWTNAKNSILKGNLRNMMAIIREHTDFDHDTVEWMHPMILGSVANASDTPNWAEAMNGPNKQGFCDAMDKELATLEGKDAWAVVDRQDWMNVLPSTWAFKVKRLPDGTVRKLKARFCVRGDRQVQDVDYFETYSPVVSWTTVRLMLILSSILNLATTQADYTAAFIHAPIQEDVYVQMPRNYQEPGKVLKLKRCLYGLKQSPRNFFLHLKAQLEAVGFESNPDVDPCLFVSDKVICLVYVDDTLFFSPKQEYIDEVIHKLKVDRKMDLEIESDVSGFLGVHVDRRADSTISLTQKGLTERIIEALNVGSLPAVRTPATPKHTLPSHELDGDPPQGFYSYPSVIGMLQYLANHTRPDITFAVAQCARYTHRPKLQHEQALERIGRYLKATSDKGLILRPDRNRPLDIDCYVDADFAGLYGFEQPHDPSSVKSRTGFVLCVSNCPVVWSSKLQHLIATSTTEAEYNALSEAMREVFPLQSSLEYLATTIGYDKKVLSNLLVTVHEDNAACLKLATLPPGQFTPRTKFYAVKVHWFRSKLNKQRRVVKIDTKLQRADILTKGLSTDSFESIRFQLCGW